MPAISCQVSTSRNRSRPKMAPKTGWVRPRMEAMVAWMRPRATLVRPMPPNWPKSMISNMGQTAAQEVGAVKPSTISMAGKMVTREPMAPSSMAHRADMRSRTE